MKNKCLIIGAGFSKSVSDLPIMSEMIDAFNRTLVKEKLSKKNIRIKWGEKLLQFLDELENIYLRKPYSKIENDGKILESNYLNNFEGLCSYIDLNLAFEVHALCESEGIKSDLSGKPLFSNFSTSKLKEIRNYLANYIYLTLINPEIKTDLLNRFYEQILNSSSTILTFNYDLILENLLYQKQLWFPKDGYGFEVQNLPELNQNQLEKISKIKLYKLHGSLNWKASNSFNNGIEFNWRDDDSNYFFPNYLADEKKRKYRYQGGYSTDAWILPSWVKQFKYPELLKVWNNAAQSLKSAEEIIIIGYSLPEADSAVFALLSAINFEDKMIAIIDPNAKKLKEKYSNVLGNTKIKIIESTLENYLS